MTAARPERPDFLVKHEGTIAILFPRTKAARDWVAESLPEDGPRMGRDGYVIGHRYLLDILRVSPTPGYSSATGTLKRVARLLLNR
jgi:hypothetical protein